MKNKLNFMVVVLTATVALSSCVRRSGSYANGAGKKETVVLVGAGDIADCRDLSGAEATAKLLDQIPGTVMAVGDLAYPDGTKENFEYYDRTWGRQKMRTRPAPGNHEFHSSAATPYFDYFGSLAGAPGDGYYSYDLGAWHIVVLNSECVEVGGCDPGFRQEKWLRTDLAAHRSSCTLAYWHKPLFSSGGAHGNDLEVTPLWQALYDAGADIVIGGHDHNYERFALQNPQGEPDTAHGIREFVVGTGGKNLRPFGTVKANSEVQNNEAFGVLKLTLHPTGYDWNFVSQEGRRFTDAGSTQCH
jgi:acid phosphatase type 7